MLCLPVSAAADTTVQSELVEVNDSGASGTVTLTETDGGGLKVVIRSEGLVPGVFHAQHIHGSGHGGHFMCPTSKDDTDGDGVLTNEEGMGEYGLIFFPLTTRGSATPKDALAADRMPVADSQGRISYERTFPAEMLPDGLLENLSSLHVVQHGIDANDNGKYDLDALGESTFAKNQGKAGVPEEVTNPAACGVVEGAEAAKPRAAGPIWAVSHRSDLNAPLVAAEALAVLAAVAAAVPRVVAADRRRPRLRPTSRHRTRAYSTSGPLPIRKTQAGGHAVCTTWCRGSIDLARRPDSGRTVCRPDHTRTSRTKGLDFTPASGSSTRSR